MKFIALILVFVLCFIGSAMSENVATPTDLIEIEDDDWGIIEFQFERRVFISTDKEPKYLGDEMILVATLIDFQPEDRYMIYWQYSEDGENWIDIENEHQQTITIIMNTVNCHYWWRVSIKLEG